MTSSKIKCFIIKLQPFLLGLRLYYSYVHGICKRKPRLLVCFSTKQGYINLFNAIKKTNLNQMHWVLSTVAKQLIMPSLKQNVHKLKK